MAAAAIVEVMVSAVVDVGIDVAAILVVWLAFVGSAAVECLVVRMVVDWVEPAVPIKVACVDCCGVESVGCFTLGVAVVVDVEVAVVTFILFGVARAAATLTAGVGLATLSVVDTVVLAVLVGVFVDEVVAVTRLVVAFASIVVVGKDDILFVVMTVVFAVFIPVVNWFVESRAEEKLSVIMVCDIEVVGCTTVEPTGSVND